MLLAKFGEAIGLGLEYKLFPYRFRVRAFAVSLTTCNCEVLL